MPLQGLAGLSKDFRFGEILSHLKRRSEISKDFQLTSLVLQRRLLNLVSYWPEIASRKARPQSCQAHGQVAMKRPQGPFLSNRRCNTRSLAGKPLATFRATLERRISVLYGIVSDGIRQGNRNAIEIRRSKIDDLDSIGFPARFLVPNFHLRRGRYQSRSTMVMEVPSGGGRQSR